MNQLHTLASLMLLSGAILTGCAPTTPHWDQHFGEAQRMMMAQQVLDHDAGLKDLPTTMDGNASRESVVRYRGSFKEPPAPQNEFTIGVGSGGAGR